MKFIKSIVAVAFLIPSAAVAQDVNGIWQTEPGDTGGFLHVTIAPCGEKVCGTIRTAFDGDKKVVADYEHIGKRLIWDMAVDGDSSWKSGKIWAPDRDKTYKGKGKLNGNSLSMSGCVLGGLICQSQKWSRL